MSDSGHGSWPSPDISNGTQGSSQDVPTGKTVLNGTTIDAFHKGGFYLVQPANQGHRAGMDAMLLAATLPQGASGSLADLGAGAGAAGLAAVNRLPGLRVQLIERSPAMVDCARQTLELPDNAHLKARARVLEADVGLRGHERRSVGLDDAAHHYVIMNPPFNSGLDRKTPDPLKAEAHAMQTEDLFEHWLRTASAILKPGGQLSVIARPQSLDVVLAASAKRFGGVEITPVCPRPGKDAIRILVTAIKGSRARLVLRDAIHIHAGAGREFSDVMNDLANGRAGWGRADVLRHSRPRRSTSPTAK